MPGTQVPERWYLVPHARAGRGPAWLHEGRGSILGTTPKRKGGARQRGCGSRGARCCGCEGSPGREGGGAPAVTF